MDLWFSPVEVRQHYQKARELLASFMSTGRSPFPRGHACYACDRDLRLTCIAWAGLAIEAVGPAHHYTSYLFDSETGQTCGPDEFLDSEAGRAGVWVSRLVSAVGNHELELVSDLTVAEMPELDMRADSLLRGAAHLTSERMHRDEMAAIERRVLADYGTVQRWSVPPPPRPPMPWGWSSGDAPKG